MQKGNIGKQKTNKIEYVDFWIAHDHSIAAGSALIKIMQMYKYLVGDKTLHLNFSMFCQYALIIKFSHYLSEPGGGSSVQTALIELIISSSFHYVSCHFRMS